LDSVEQSNFPAVDLENEAKATAESAISPPQVSGDALRTENVLRSKTDINVKYKYEKFRAWNSKEANKIIKTRMLRHGAFYEDGVTYTQIIDLENIERDDLDRITVITVKITITVWLPKWKNIGAQCPCVRRMYESYIRHLKEHESEHLRIELAHEMGSYEFYVINFI
jgi:predicted secreted Zn-dependent protease